MHCRDWSKFDVVFANFDGRNPADGDFNLFTRFGDNVTLAV